MTKRIATLSLIAAALMGGCRTIEPPIEGRADPYALPQITFATAGLRQRTAMMPPVVQRDDAGNLLFVTLTVRNTTSRAFTIDYKTTFLDRNGGKVSETGWLSQPIEAGTPATISVNSTSDHAADFQIALRQAK